MHSLVYKMSAANLSDTSIASETGRRSHSHKGHRRYSSISAIASDGEEEEENFKSEAIASIERSITENHDVDIAALELNTLRMTMNVPYPEVREATIAAFVKYIQNSFLQEPLLRYLRLRRFYALGRSLSDNHLTMMIKYTYLHYFKRMFGNPSRKAIMLTAVEALYDDEHVLEDNIYIWFDSEESQSSEPLRAIRDILKSFVDWLKTAEEEGSEDESD